MTQAQANSSPPRPKTLRVALVAGAETLANLGPAVRHLLVSLLDEPMHVWLICPDRADTAYVPDPPVAVIRHGSLRVPFLRRKALDALAAEVDRTGASLLHALDADALPATRQLADRLDLDYVLSVLSTKPWLHGVGRRCRAVLAAAEPIRRVLVESRVAPAELVAVLPPGVHRVRKATCFMDPRHAPAIVAAGRLEAFEHFAAVLEAFARLRARRPECVLFIVGAGRSETRLRRLAAELGLMASLTFVQSQDTELLANIVKAADIFVSPVPSERVEIDLLTAMASGAPVVAAGAEATDALVNGQTALTYTPADADDLAGRLNSLLEDRAWARGLAENALAYLAEHHSPARMAGCLADLYHTVVGR